jgi:hypothetical protein
VFFGSSLNLLANNLHVRKFYLSLKRTWNCGRLVGIKLNNDFSNESLIENPLKIHLPRLKNYGGFFILCVFMNINQLLIKDLVELNKLRHLAVFIKFKGIYSSGCVHNYTPSKFSHKAKLSRNSVKKYIDYFIANGWARMEGNNLIFNKFRSFDLNKKRLMCVMTFKKSIREIELLLYREVLRLKQSQFNFLKQTKCDLQNPTGIEVYKKAIKLKKKYTLKTENLPGAQEKYKVSIKKIAESFNCSVGKAMGIIDKLCENNQIKRFRQMEVVCFGVPKAIVQQCLNVYKGSYFSRNQVVYRYTNKYTF